MTIIKKRNHSQGYEQRHADSSQKELDSVHQN